ALGVRLRPEGPHRAVGMAEGLQTLEDLLAVVQHGRRRGELQRPVRQHRGLAPPRLLGPAGVGHEVGEVGAEPGGGEDAGALVVGDATDGAGLGEVERAHGILLGAGFRVSVTGAGAQRPEIAATRASPICAVPRSASSGDPARAERSFSTAARTAAAGSRWPRWSSSSATESTVAVGSARSFPAMSGAEPCTGSNIEGKAPVGLMLPLAARPMPPPTAAARSVTMSPKRLSVTITSKRDGSWTR